MRHCHIKTPPLQGSSAASFVLGYRQIAHSPLLRLMAVHVALQYATSSMCYFTKLAVLAESAVPGGRPAWFATINAATGVGVWLAQVAATGEGA